MGLKRRGQGPAKSPFQGAKSCEGTAALKESKQAKKSFSPLGKLVAHFDNQVLLFWPFRFLMNPSGFLYLPVFPPLLSWLHH